MIRLSQISPSLLLVLPAVLLGMALEHKSGAVESPCPVGAPTEIHYAPSENLEAIDVALLRTAERQIDMAALTAVSSKAKRRGLASSTSRPSSAGASRASSCDQARLAASSCT